MNSFEYITVLVSIVIGLAIADLVTSLHRLLAAGKQVRWDWIAPTAALLVLLELFNLWWKWHAFRGTTFGEVMPYFAVLILLFLSAAAALPDAIPAGGLSLRDYWHDKQRYFFAVYTLYVAGWIGMRTVQVAATGASASTLVTTFQWDYLTILAYVVMFFWRRTVLGGLVLLGSLVWLGRNWWAMTLGG